MRDEKRDFSFSGKGKASPNEIEEFLEAVYDLAVERKLDLVLKLRVGLGGQAIWVTREQRPGL